MSDLPKPKPGSLRDRIAAFENKAASSAQQPSPPPPRPKPAGFATWKPKSPSPPPSPAAPSSPGADVAKAGSAGMSAADAKESITRGGSLKERMAALQGRGAFGAPTPPLAPKPLEKPKWKPPPPVASPPPIDDESDGTKSLAEPAISPPPSIKSPPPVRSPRSTSEEETVGGGLEDTLTKETSAEDGEDATAEVDPEEEERQRRAAIAARMAKLGGARLGMAPPILGVKPTVRTEKPQQPKEEERPPMSEQTKSPEAAPSPPAEEPADASTSRTEDVSVPTPEPASIHSAESDASQSSRSPPTTMPVPVVPRRTAPPRRKPAKLPVATPTNLEEVNEGEIVPKSPSPAEEAAAPAITAEPEIQTDVAENPPRQELEGTGVDQPSVERDESADAGEKPLTPSASTGPVPMSLPKEASFPTETEEQEASQQEDEEDEEARRRRVAEKLSKMGGIQPFALPSIPPLRRPSGGSIRSNEGPASPPTSPPLPFKKPSLRKDSADSVGASPPVRKSSVGSVKAPGTEEVIIEPEGTITSVIPEEEDAPALRDEEPRTSNVEIEHDNDNEQEKQDEDVSDEDDVYDRSGAGGSHDYELTPQLPSRVPTAVTSELRVREPSALENKSCSQVDPDVVASVLPPPPLTTPPAPPMSTPTFAPSASLTSPPSHPVPSPSAPLPPRVVVEQQPISPPADKLAGPSPPRRIVPNTPEESESGNERDDDEADSNSELAASTLFVPHAGAAGSSGVFQASLGDEQDDGGESEPPLRVPTRSIPLPVGGKIAGPGGAYDDTDAESNASGVPLPVPLPVCGPGGARLGYSPVASERSLDDGEDDRDRRGVGGGGVGMVSSPLARPTRAAPPPPPAEEGSGSEYGDDIDQAREKEESVLRTKPFLGGNEVPLIVRPPLAEPEEEQKEVVDEGMGEPIASPPLRGLPPPPDHSLPRGQTPLAEVGNQEQEADVEVLDEEEGDPIDPAFHSPSRRASTVYLEPGPGPASVLSPSVLALSPPSAPLPKAPPTGRTETSQPSDDEGGAEKARKQTIAERMAKLGGIKFGAAPVPGGIPRPPVPRRTYTEDEVGGDDGEADRERQPDEEEDERARRERIAAKLAGMGGMRIGMMPMNMPPTRSHALKEEALPAEPARSSPTRALPPTRPPPPSHLQTQTSVESESDRGSANISEDGVKVEAEESEMEEVGYEDVKDVEEPVAGQEVPPPVPARGSRSNTSSTATAGRPPVPAGLPFRRASGRSASEASTGSARKVSGQQHSDFVLVEEPKGINEEEEDVPPPPPARPTDRVLPTRAPPPVPRSSSSRPTMADSISSQWELPAIPSSSLDLDSGGGDLSLSWSEASVDERESGAGQTPQVVPVPPPHARAPEALQLSADELMAMWGRVGVQICEIATTMYDKSKKTLVGDGTYKGFVDAVLAQVPNASKPMMPSVPYGYLVHLQNGSAVQKRASEIMPGDVIELVDARFKGYKGLAQGYQMHVGAAETGGAVVGIVSEFDHKKSKTRVFHANQHAGQQAVEAVSYRLDDLKSGLVKVYRVLEA